MIPEILLCEDDPSIALVLSQAITQHGYRVRSTDRLTTLMQWIEAGDGDLVITDVTMPHGGLGGDGLALLPRMRAHRLAIPIIVISAHNTLLNAARARTLGATIFLPKPFDLSELLAGIDQALGRNQTRQKEKDTHVIELSPELAIVGHSDAMQEVYRSITRLIGNDLTVIIHGESGTGKELIARAIHELGPRKSKPFHAINMAALPRELIESELFGHERGAFTGANQRKIGAFEQAHGGTLFLDEIGDMPLDAQTRLLRVLQQGEYTPVGGVRVIRSNVRIVAATHRDLMALVKSGEFREDLFYRLNVVPLKLPALRERIQDIEPLVRYFLNKAHKRGLPLKSLHPDAIAALQAHTWHGNIRELENITYRLAALQSAAEITALHITQELYGVAQAPQKIHLLSETSSQERAKQHGASLHGTKLQGEIVSEHLTSHIESHLRAYFAAHSHGIPAAGLYDRMMCLLEKPLIEHTLRATDGNQIQAARILGINRNTLRKKIAELGIEIRSVLSRVA